MTDHSGGQQVVIVDDEPELLVILGDVLELEGFGVLCLDHPAKVASTIQDQHPALVLLHIMMPGISGIELAQQLHSMGFERTPTIALSASWQMVQVARRSDIFQTTVHKPFDLDDRLSLVQRYLADAASA